MIGLVIVIIVVLIVAFFIWGFFIPSEPKKQQPYFDPYNREPTDIEKLEEDLYDLKGFSEEDVREILGDPKPLTEKEKKQSERIAAIIPKFDEDDLPF